MLKFHLKKNKKTPVYTFPFCVFTGKSERASFIGYGRDTAASGCQVSFSSDFKFMSPLKAPTHTRAHTHTHTITVREEGFD